MRGHPPPARDVETAARLLEDARRRRGIDRQVPGDGRERARHVEDVRPRGAHVVVGEREGRLLGREGGAHLRRRPGEELSLDAFAVRIRGGVEPAPGRRQVAPDVGERLADDARELVSSRHLVGFQVDECQERIVVEHLLEVRHAPADVGRVAVEATAHVIVDAAPGHRFQRLHHHAERRGIARAAVVAEQELELERFGKPGRAPEAAVRRVERPLELAEGAPEDVGAWHLLARRGGHLLADAAREVGGRGSRPVGVLGVDRVHPPEEREEAEAHPAVAVARGEIGATVERLPVRREPHGHRPAAVPRHHLDGGHVDGVDVGPSLAIDLDGDVVLVQLGGDLLVVERLLLHHVAPVARRVADAQENRPVLAPRAFERLLTPGVPVDGVVRVLEQVRAGGLGQSVRAHPASVSRSRPSDIRGLRSAQGFQ